MAANISPIDVNEMTFGVEIECCLPIGVRIQVGGYHSGIQVEGLPAGWTAQHDSSLRAPRAHRGVEIVSPILKGADGLRQIKQVCDWLASKGAKVNPSCGLHVHVGWGGDEDALKRLVHYVANFEKAIYASTGTKARENGHYCGTVRNDYTYARVFRNGERRSYFDRYKVLNLKNLDTKHTVEFRAFAGTTSALKIISHVRMCLGMVERAVRIRKASEWNGTKVNPGRGPYKGKGEGQIELTRLFFGLGWSKGDTKHVYGDIQPDGLPTIEESKAELGRLAAKYDGRAEANA
jgi:hypothetical protein